MLFINNISMLYRHIRQGVKKKLMKELGNIGYHEKITSMGYFPRYDPKVKSFCDEHSYFNFI